MNDIVVIGGGFAGLWSAIGAARRLDELGIGADRVEITLINRDAWHGIRVRNYESDLSELRVPLDHSQRQRHRAYPEEPGARDRPGERAPAGRAGLS